MAGNLKIPGSVRQAISASGKPIWLVEVDNGTTLNGKRSRTRRTVHSRAEAERVRKDLYLDSRSATLVPSTTETVEAFGHYWLHSVKNGRIRSSTLADYESRLRQYAYPTFGNKRLGDVRPRDIESWMADLRAKGLGIATVNGARTVLNQLFKHAVSIGSIPTNPVGLTGSMAHQYGEPTQVQPPWTREEAQGVLRAAKGTPLDLFVTLQLSYGLRRGEALGLRWEDIDYERGTLSIERTMKQVRAYSADGATSVSLQVDHPKTTSGHRKLLLVPLVSEALMRHTEEHDRAVVMAGHAWNESGYVFTTRVGTPVSPSNLRRLYVKFLEQHGIRFIRIHDMRHTAAGLSLEQGVRIEAVSQALGHKDILMTKSIYAPNVQALNDEFARGLGDYLAPMKDSIDELNADQMRGHRPSVRREAP